MELLCAGSASCSGRKQERARGSAGVWTGAGDGAQDAALLDSTGLLAEGVGSAAETGAVAGRDRRHSGRRQEQTSQAAAHGEADLRPPAAGVWLHGRLYDREPHPG